MIIGSIEFCAAHEVAGWIYSPKATLTGETILAFVDDVCVGSGTITLHRQDLADAGLGDGRFGFLFPITLPDPEDVARVVVTLMNCEAIIIQNGSSVQGPRLPKPCELPNPGRVDWMQRRGLLSAVDADALRSLVVYGVTPYTVEPAQISAGLLQLFEAIHLGPVTLDHLDLPAEDDLDTNLREQLYVSATPVFALHSLRPATFMVLETAEGDNPPAGSAKDRLGTIDYLTNEGTLLLIRHNVPFAIKPMLNRDTIRCYYPVAANDVTDA